MVFDDGAFSKFETTLIPDRLAHAPREVVWKNWAGANGVSPVAFDFPMHAMKPTHKSASGSVRIVDTRGFPVSTTVTEAYVIVRPGGMRELHWHQRAGERQYFIQGQARQTLFDNGNKARTMNLRANDVGYIPKTLPHYLENTGTDDLIFLEMFKTDTYLDVSQNNWIRHAPERVVLDHSKISRETLAAVTAEEGDGSGAGTEGWVNDVMDEKHYSDPALRQRLKDEIQAGDKGGHPGQWSARKSQLLAHEYEAHGGKYVGPKSEEAKHLDEWTKEDWHAKDGEKAQKEDGSTSRYLPDEAWNKLTPAQQKATDDKKREHSKHGEQHVANTEAAKHARSEATEHKK